MSNKVQETLRRINELKESAGYKEIEDYLNYREESHYFLNEVLTDGKLEKERTEFRKYILKSYNNEFIYPASLNSDRKLHRELTAIISEFLGVDYLLIASFENRINYRNNDDMELFHLVFKKTFSTMKSGEINVIKLEDCPKGIAIGDVENNVDNRVSIQLNYVYQKYFTYEGHKLKNENVLFYGFNIEKNPYLVKLFETNPPNKLLNIVPVNHRNSFFYDNLD